MPWCCPVEVIVEVMGVWIEANSSSLLHVSRVASLSVCSMAVIFNNASEWVSEWGSDEGTYWAVLGQLKRNISLQIYILLWTTFYFAFLELSLMSAMHPCKFTWIKMLGQGWGKGDCERDSWEFLSFGIQKFVVEDCPSRGKVRRMGQCWCPYPSFHISKGLSSSSQPSSWRWRWRLSELGQGSNWQNYNMSTSICHSDCVAPARN